MGYAPLDKQVVEKADHLGALDVPPRPVEDVHAQSGLFCVERLEAGIHHQNHDLTQYAIRPLLDVVRRACDSGLVFSVRDLTQPQMGVRFEGQQQIDL